MGIVAVVPVTCGGGACRYGFPPRHKHSPGQGPAGELAFHTNVTQSRARKRHEGSGLMRTYLVVIDDSPEAALALRFAARRAARTGGAVMVLAIVPPTDFLAFGGVQAERKGTPLNSHP